MELLTNLSGDNFYYHVLKHMSHCSTIYFHSILNIKVNNITYFFSRKICLERQRRTKPIFQTTLYTMISFTGTVCSDGCSHLLFIRGKNIIEIDRISSVLVYKAVHNFKDLFKKYSIYLNSYIQSNKKDHLPN